MARAVRPRLVYPPSLSCPNCRSGSSHLYQAALGKSEWDHVVCGSCKEGFEIATAEDEALVEYGPWSMSSTFTCVTQTFVARWGTSHLLKIGDVLDEVYDVSWGMNGSILAGGVVVQRLPEHVMIAVAPNPNPGEHQPTVEVAPIVAGRPKGTAPLPAWRDLFVRARASAAISRRLPPILSIAGVDAFVADRWGGSVKIESRPSDWAATVNANLSRRLIDILGARRFNDHLITAVRIRNELAHDGDAKAPMKAALREREEAWENRNLGGDLVGNLQFAPSGRFVLRECLAVVRAVRREEKRDTRILTPEGIR